MKKIFAVLAFLTFHFNMSATHIVGGDITVKWLGPNSYEVKLRFFRDCSSTTAFDNPVNIGVYDKVTNAFSFSFPLPQVSSNVLTLGDSCFTPSGLCVEQGVFLDTITIPNNPNGYYLSWQRCCRNGIIQNISLPGDAGMVYYVEIPDPAMVNSSPIINSYPNAYMCSSQPNVQDFSATDADGDSLAYFLSTPLNGFGSPMTTTPVPSAATAGPYSNVTWLSPYSAGDMVGGTPAMSIDPVTGILTAAPTTLGVYVFAVVVKEFRAGVEIGLVRLDIQYKVMTCNTNAPPTFTVAASTSFDIVAGDSLCLTINANDVNDDWVAISASSDLFTSPTTMPYTTFITDSAQTMVSSSFCFASNCDHIRSDPYTATFYARDYSCYGTNVVPYELSFKVVSPIDGKLDKIIPNVFTPNHDNKNDYFKVNVDNLTDCFDDFDIKIYTRWGELVYESQEFKFKWDGKDKKGKPLVDGVYFYTLKGDFNGEGFDYKGNVQILH